MPPHRSTTRRDRCLRDALLGQVADHLQSLGALLADEFGGFRRPLCVDVGDADGASARGELDRDLAAEPAGRPRHQRSLRASRPDFSPR